VVVVSVPSNYDDASITMSIDANSLYQTAITAMPNHAQNLADSVAKIVGIWNNLKAAWVGSTSDEAQDFNTQWSTAVNNLFGSQSDSKSGILPKIANAVAAASYNYGDAEDTIWNSMNAYAAGLNAGSDPNAVQPPAGGTSSSGPVTVTTPGPPNTPPPPSPAAPQQPGVTPGLQPD
jgi:hypothetical protein